MIVLCSDFGLMLGIDDRTDHNHRVGADDMSRARCCCRSAPRHAIFRRNATSVATLDAFGALMRYNNYLHDPLSHGSPMNAIMARGDLAGSAGGGNNPRGSVWVLYLR